MSGTRPVSTSVLVAAGATASGTFTFENQTSRNLIVVLSTTTASAGNTVQVTINGVTASGYIYPLLVGSTVAAVATTPLRIGPALTPSPNAVADDVIPETVQIVVTVVGTVAYGIDVTMAP